MCSYIVVKEKTESIQIKHYLQERLPHYMIPKNIVQLEKLPLNSNGKVDRKALLARNDEVCNTSEYKAPRNEVDKKIASIWEEILGVENIGIKDDFYDIGGNSLKLTKLAYILEQNFNINAKIQEMVKMRSVEDISDFVVERSETLEKKDYLVFNKSEKKTLFCFPPLIGYGLVYKKISTYFDDWAFYAFKYNNDEECIKQYADSIISLSNEDPYILLGYSAGGIIAFEVAFNITFNLNVHLSIS